MTPSLSVWKLCVCAWSHEATPLEKLPCPLIRWEVFHESYIVQAYREEAQRSVKDVTLSSKDCFTKRLVIKNDFEEEEANVDNLPTFIATTIPHPQVNGVALISNEGIESRSTHPIMVGEEGFVLVVTVVVESNETEGHLARRIIGFLSDTAYTDSLTSKGLDWQYVIDLVAIDSTDQAPKFAIDSDFEKNVMEIVEEQCEGCLGVAKTIITPGLGQFPNAYRCNYSNN